MLRPFFSSTKDAEIKSLSLNNCLAKTYFDNQRYYAGRDVVNHCHIVGMVARTLMRRMPNWLADDLFPNGCELIAACHDLGKVSPTFQKKIHDALHQALPEVFPTPVGVFLKKGCTIINSGVFPTPVGGSIGVVVPLRIEVAAERQQRALLDSRL